MVETKRLLTLIALSVFFLTSCVGEGGSGRKERFTNNSSTGVNDGEGSSTGGNSGAIPGSGDTVGDDGGMSIGSQVELMHLVDPFDGTYKKKLTLPKNFTGLLYLSGLNISSLADRLVYARFVFGKEYEPVVIPATIGRAPGITPQTDVEVVILDMASHPFENMRLSYNLFDYNDYTEEGRANGLDEIVTDPRDAGLYCRGLHSKDDKTFESGVGNSSCDTAGEVCKYTYARVEDVGLYYDTNTSSLPFFPTEAQLALRSNDYESDYFSNSIKKCLPDSIDKAVNETSLGVTFTGGFGVGVQVDTNGGVCGDTPGEDCYTYRGPYRDIDKSSWQISAGAVFSDVSSTVAPTGIFKKALGTSGYESFLFPRAGRMDLQAGVEYIGSPTPLTANTVAGTDFDILSLTANGDSEYVYGCGIRATNYDSSTQEGINSCNVTARVELFTKDADGEETIITQSNNIVLQLIRPSLTDYRGQEVLYTSMKTCSSSQSCGGSECCFNNRCWSKELVSQCLEDVPVVGNKGVGESCQTDYECSSICCNQTTGSCGVHLNTEDEQSYCSKSPGQSCVAKEWCREENVPNCFIVKTGTDNVGQQTCALRCYNVPTFGDCTNGTCTPPSIPAVPSFDPSNPDCSEAIDPPTFN